VRQNAKLKIRDVPAYEGVKSLTDYVLFTRKGVELLKGLSGVRGLLSSA